MSGLWNKAFFVNLDCRPDRLALMTAELSRVGIDAERVRGMLPHECKADPSDIRVMMNRTPGAVGAHYCQREALRLGMNHGNTLIMEDDCQFCDDLPERMAIIEPFLNEREWGCLWLGGTVHINPAVWHKDTLGRDAETTDNPRMIRTYGAWSTYAYIISAEWAERVLKLLDDHVHESIGIDYLFIKFATEIPQFMFLPGLVKQRDGRSNIGTFTTFSDFHKLGPYWWQRRMGDFDVTSFNFGEARV